jgi:site-specific DNA recombinase
MSIGGTDLYTRKSSESEDRQITSNEDQRDVMVAKAKLLGIKIDRILPPESKSAKAPGQRPCFEELMQRVESGKTQRILAWNLNRLFRNPVDAARVQWCLQQGILKEIVTAERIYRPEDNMLLFAVESGLANQFILDLRKATMRGTQSKLQHGGTPFKAPQGYVNVRQGDESWIEKDPDRFDVVRKMWDMLLTGTYMVRQIAAIASTEWGYRTRKTKRLGGRELATSTLFKIFTSQFYAGIIEYDGAQFEGKHPRMITPDEFDRAQEILGRRGKPRPQKHTFTFAGMIQCGECGCMVVGDVKHKRLADGSTKTYTYYHCTRRSTRVACSQRKVITAEQLDRLVEQGMGKFEIRPELKVMALDMLNKENDREIEELAKIYESQERRYSEAQREINNLTRMRYREQVSEEFYLAEKAELEAQIVRLKSKLDNTDTHMAEWRQLTDDAFNFAAHARTAFRDGNAQTKREIMAALGTGHTLMDGELFIQTNSWLKPIEKGYPEVEAAFALVRTAEDASDSVFLDVRKQWYTIVTDVRTAVFGEQRPIHIFRDKSSELLLNPDGTSDLASAQ